MTDELARVADAPVPVYSPAQMIEALTAYRQLQRALDDAMPDAIVSIQGRPHRRAAYWRAIGFAFRISVTPVDEQRAVQGRFADGTENFGYAVICRATGPNGRSVLGDGCAYAIEKAAKFKCPHPHPTREGKSLHYPPEACPAFDALSAWHTFPAAATEHNVRALAFTRAQCRAIANLVGFGDGVAEEDDTDRPAPRRARKAPRPTPDMIDAAQRKRLFERAHEAGYTDEALREWLTTKGIAETAQIRRDDYDALLDELLLDRPSAAAATGEPA